MLFWFTVFSIDQITADQGDYTSYNIIPNAAYNLLFFPNYYSKQTDKSTIPGRDYMTCRLIACWQRASKFIPHFVAPHVSISGIISSKKRSDNHKFPISFTIIRFSNKAHLEPAAWNYYYFSLIIISFNSCFFGFISKLHNLFTTSPASLLIWNQKSKT